MENSTGNGNAAGAADQGPPTAATSAPAVDSSTGPAVAAAASTDGQPESASGNNNKRKWARNERHGHQRTKAQVKKQKNMRGEQRRDRRPQKREWFAREDAAAAAAAAAGSTEEGGGDGKTEPRASRMRIPFSAEEIAAEARRPKRKVAVLLGYAGTGYRGMQINHDEKTIEGDLFAALVGAGAIAKTNADDPKKSSFVRCARTDKGVHAAGNVVSLKLIVEDEDIVERINALLPPQIRVWGIRRTINSFSCYQACDSRWYEYLLPSYALLPPHPDSFLGREMVASARRADEKAAAGAAEGGAYAEMTRRLADVQDFWADVERDKIQPLLQALEPEVRTAVLALLHSTDEFQTVGHRSLNDLEQTAVDEEGKKRDKTEKTEAAEADKTRETKETKETEVAEKEDKMDEDTRESKPAETVEADPASAALKAAVDQALRDIKAAYVTAKRAYRVTPARLQQLQEALSQYEGTRNYHNYTVQKTFKDASAKRHIKSFVVNPEPIQIRDTQWLSLRVHGQSFMMHQIRKMVAMAVMLTRCGTSPEAAMELSFGARRISIPRAPGLGLLLERPVFDSYNERAEASFGREPIAFDDFEAEIRAFKDREIYARIWDVEESQNLFHAFFQQLDNYHTNYYLWAITGGFEAAYERFGHGQSGPKQQLLPGDADEEEEVGGEEEG